LFFSDFVLVLKNARLLSYVTYQLRRCRWRSHRRRWWPHWHVEAANVSWIREFSGSWTVRRVQHWRDRRLDK